MIKNDFVIWGERESASGEKLPIRFHLAIDEKPLTGNSYTVYIYEDEIDKVYRAKRIFNIGSQEYSDDETFLDEQNLHDTSIIYQIGDKYYQYNAIEKTYINVDSSNIKTIKTYEWRSELYFQGVTSSLYGTDVNDYYVELVNEWPKLYDITFSGPTAEKATGFWNETLEGVNLDYFLDMINSSSSEVGKYSVGNIGRRSKVINDN